MVVNNYILIEQHEFSCSALKLDECSVSRNHLEFELI